MNASNVEAVTAHSSARACASRRRMAAKRRSIPNARVLRRVSALLWLSRRPGSEREMDVRRGLREPVKIGRDPKIAKARRDHFSHESQRRRVSGTDAEVNRRSAKFSGPLSAAAANVPCNRRSSTSEALTS